MLSIECSGYYAWFYKKPGKRQQQNEALDKKIISIFNSHIHRYGSPRITIELRDNGESCSKYRVTRRMNHLGLRAKGKKKFKLTTNSSHELPVSDNMCYS